MNNMKDVIRICRICRKCGKMRAASGCVDCGTSVPAPSVNSVHNTHYSAPIQNNIHLSVESDEPDPEPSRAPYREEVSSKILRWSLTFMTFSCGLVASAVVVFIFSVTFLAMMRIR
jgi:hypothetical protein